MARYLLYHGTTKEAYKDILENGISLKKTRDTADFGAGFYLTPNKGVAKARVANKLNPAVMQFELNGDDLSVKKFKLDDEWKEEVFRQRILGIDDLTDYDYIVGPIADGIMRRMIKAYNIGEITKEEFLNNISHGELPKKVQIVIKSYNAVNQCKFCKEG